MVLAKNRLSLLSVGTFRIILVLSLVLAFYSWQRTSAETASDMSWSWTYDGKRGLQVVMVLGSTWTNTAGQVRIEVDGAHAETITAPAANAITVEKVESITSAPTNVTLRIIDTSGSGYSLSTLLASTDGPQNPENLVPSTLGWTSQSQGNKSLIQVVLPASGLAANVAAIEVYPNFTAGDSPKKTSEIAQGGDLPTGTVLDVLVTELTAPATSYRLQFLDNSGNLLTFSDGTSKNSSVVSSTTTRIPVVESSSANIAVAIPTATPVPEPTPTPSLPGTGDYTPGSGMVVALMVIGTLMILMGGAYVFTNRRTE